jgi:hypothetical protein
MSGGDACEAWLHKLEVQPALETNRNEIIRSGSATFVEWME